MRGGKSGVNASLEGARVQLCLMALTITARTPLPRNVKKNLAFNLPKQVLNPQPRSAVGTCLTRPAPHSCLTRPLFIRTSISPPRKSCVRSSVTKKNAPTDNRQVLLIRTGTEPEAATSSGEAVAAREERLESSALTSEAMRWNRDEAILDQAHREAIGFGINLTINNPDC